MTSLFLVTIHQPSCVQHSSCPDLIHCLSHDSLISQCPQITCAFFIPFPHIEKKKWICHNKCLSILYLNLYWLGKITQVKRLFPLLFQEKFYYFVWHFPIHDIKLLYKLFYPLTSHSLSTTSQKISSSLRKKMSLVLPSFVFPHPRLLD